MAVTVLRRILLMLIDGWKTRAVVWRCEPRRRLGNAGRMSVVPVLILGRIRSCSKLTRIGGTVR